MAGVLVTNVEPRQHVSGGAFLGVRTTVHHAANGWDWTSGEITVTEHNGLVDAAQVSFMAFAAAAYAAWGTWWSSTLTTNARFDVHEAYLVVRKLQ